MRPEGGTAEAGRSGVFLDRDGTLIEDVGYLQRPEDVRLLAGVAAALARLNAAGASVVLVTNQSGIARGLFTREDFDAAQERLAELLQAEGARLDAVYVCPHHPDVDGPCDCRKPASRLYWRASRDLGLDLSRSYYVGDRWRDVAVTLEVGGTPILVTTGEGAEDAPNSVPRVADLSAAVDRILATLAERERR